MCFDPGFANSHLDVILFFLLQIYLHSMQKEGVALKKMPLNRELYLPGVTEASVLDLSLHELSVYVADAKQGTVDLLKLGNPRSRDGLTPAGQILKLKVEFNKSFIKF